MQKLYKALDKLSKEDEAIINKHFFKNKSLKSMADEEKLNYKKLLREKNRILEKIKGIIENVER